MRIEEIKESIKELINKEQNFKLNGTRNQTEEFKGKIIKMYNSIFVIKESNTEILRTFTYSDILIKNLVINAKK